MSKILETRRVRIIEEVQEMEYRYIKNPHYSEVQRKAFVDNGWGYNQEMWIMDEVPVTRKKVRTHIEYRIECAHCKGTSIWVRRKDAIYCDPNCRKLAQRERKKNLL